MSIKFSLVISRSSENSMNNVFAEYSSIRGEQFHWTICDKNV